MRGPDPIDAFVAASVRLRRRKLGMSQAGRAARIGVTSQQVQTYENATNRMSVSALVRIADALETTVSDLMPDGPAVQPAYAVVSAFASEAWNLHLVSAGTQLADAQRGEVMAPVLGLARKAPRRSRNWTGRPDAPPRASPPRPLA